MGFHFYPDLMESPQMAAITATDTPGVNLSVLVC